MGLMIKIIEIHGREILDSRGNPTVEVEVTAQTETTGKKTKARCAIRANLRKIWGDWAAGWAGTLFWAWSTARCPNKLHDLAVVSPLYEIRSDCKSEKNKVSGPRIKRRKRHSSRCRYESDCYQAAHQRERKQECNNQSLSKTEPPVSDLWERNFSRIRTIGRDDKSGSPERHDWVDKKAINWFKSKSFLTNSFWEILFYLCTP